MAIATTDVARTYENPAATGLSARFEALRVRFAAWRLYRRTVNELNGLRTADLLDLGIDRSNIRSIAWQSVYS
jgi:uncharacterized protein YjiS (DUF1127 family)